MKANGPVDEACKHGAFHVVIFGNWIGYVIVPDPIGGHMPEPTIATTIEPGWITKPEAIEITGISVKRFEQFVKRHHIRTGYVPVPGRRPMPIYPEADIRAVLKRPKAPRAVAADKSLAALSTTLQEIRKSAREAFSPEVPNKVPADRKHLLTMREAHALGWPLDVLRRLKQRENPPGLWYGRRAFKFSADLLRMELEG